MYKDTDLTSVSFLVVAIYILDGLCYNNCV